MSVEEIKAQLYPDDEHDPILKKPKNPFKEIIERVRKDRAKEKERKAKLREEFLSRLKKK